MKVLVLTLFIALSLLGKSTVADLYKGQTYYKYIIGPKLGYNGIVFTKQHTQKEWEKLFSNEAKALYEHYNLSKKEVTQEMLPHLRYFAIFYAKDSKAVPYCGE
jgi:predicted methyltransferase